ncbi:MAG: hypothetical protein ACHP9Z_21985 [Streptosporangiales bacterium]
MTAAAAGRRPSSRVTAVTLAALVLATLIGTAAVPSGISGSVADLLAGLGIVLMIAITATVGLLVAWHQPGNPIGWLLLASSLLYPVGLNAAPYSTFYTPRWALGASSPVSWRSCSRRCGSRRSRCSRWSSCSSRTGGCRRGGGAGWSGRPRAPPCWSSASRMCRRSAPWPGTSSG